MAIEESYKEEKKMVKREVTGWMSTISEVKRILNVKNVNISEFKHKALFIAKNIIRAEALCKLVESFNMQVKVYHSGIKKRIRGRILSDFDKVKQITRLVI